MKKYISADAFKTNLAGIPYLQMHPGLHAMLTEWIDEMPEAHLSEREQDLIRERDDFKQMYHLAQDKVQSLTRELRMYEETVDAIGG